MREKNLFEEKQYLGFNKFSIIRRFILIIFCFLGFYWSENPKPIDISGIHIGSYPAHDIPHSGQLFLILGCILILASFLMIFTLHLHTRVTEKNIILIGLWTKRVVKIDLANIVHVRKVIYQNTLLKQAVYNLHRQGIIRFYTSGNEAIEISDKDGLKYRIGTKKGDELLRILQNKINS
jgi:hypothetical protein